MNTPYIPYRELLRDPRWQKKRLEVFERANFECESCGSQNKNLHAHHRSYKRGAKPWEYPGESLECLCEECHLVATQQRDSLNKELESIDADSLSVLIGVAKGLAVQGVDTYPVALNNYEEVYGFSLVCRFDIQQVIERLSNGMLGPDQYHELLQEAYERKETSRVQVSKG